MLSSAWNQRNFLSVTTFQSSSKSWMNDKDCTALFYGCEQFLEVLPRLISKDRALLAIVLHAKEPEPHD
jgi:hypothetical protein